MLLFLLGAGYEDEDELTDDDRKVLNGMYQLVVSSVAGIMARIGSGLDMGPTIRRIRNFVLGAYYYAYMAHGLDDETLYVWSLGDTEHCSTCLDQAAKGPMPGSHWAEMAAAGIYPNSPDLECTGLHCQCEIEEA